MSVSMKDRKDVIYAELERFRALCDRQEQQLRAAAAEKPAPKRRRPFRVKGINVATFAGDACKHFGKKAVSIDEIMQYISEVEAA